MERSCEVQLMVDAAAANGIPKVYIDDAMAKEVSRMALDAETLYWEFQPGESKDWLCFHSAI